MHRRYRKLCALLATGQIEAADRASLEQHLESCSKCRSFLDDIMRIGARGMAMPATDRAEDSPAEPPAGIRERFLQRAAAEGFQLNPGLVIANTSAAGELGSSKRGVAVQPSKRPGWLMIPPLAPFHAVMAITACVAFGIFGYLIALDRFSAKKPAIRSAVTTTAMASTTQDLKIQQSERQHSADLEARLQAISSQLASAQKEKEELTRKLAEAAQQIAKGSVYELEFKQQTRDLQDAEERVSKLRSDLDAAQHQVSEKDAVLVAQQQIAQDANAKLAETEQQLRKLGELQSARSEIGQLISARNLHIVDVRDSEPGAKRQTAFGRVFYVEGQSLVFYAYDLADSVHSNRQITFHVWGETASVKETTFSLGVLHSDDSGHSRWVLTFDDPKVLNRINAVYITADRDVAAKKTPQGRKLLYAFLGTPNHP